MRFPWQRSPRTEKVPQISAEELKRWLDADRPLQLVDARTGLEYRQGTIAAARHAPMAEMPVSLQRLDLAPDKPVVVLCLSGHRSLPGARWLLAHGYEAYSLQGGLLSWKRAGFTLALPEAHRDQAG